MWFDSLRIYAALSIRKSKDKSVFSRTPGYYCSHGEKGQKPIRHFFRKIEKQAWLQAVGPTLSFSSKHFLIRFFLIAQVCPFILLSESCLANYQIDGVLVLQWINSCFQCFLCQSWNKLTAYQDGSNSQRNRNCFAIKPSIARQYCCVYDINPGYSMI